MLDISVSEGADLFHLAVTVNADDGGRNGDHFVEHTAPHGKICVVDQHHGRGDHDALAQILNVREVQKQGVRHQGHDDQQRHRPLPGHRAHDTHQGGKCVRPEAVGKDLEVFSENDEVADDANNVQNHSRPSTQQKIADADTQCGNGLNDDKLFVFLALVGKEGDQGGDPPHDLSGDDHSCSPDGCVMFFLSKRRFPPLSL